MFSEWEHRIAEARERTARLTVRSQSSSAQETEFVALQELSLTHEELAVAEEELRTQNEELNLAHVLIDAERHRYRELFFSAPVPYLVTDKHGTVVEGNQALAALLGKRVEWLCGKPLIVFAKDISRRRIRNLILRLNAGEDRAAARVILAVPDVAVPVRVTVAAARGAHGELVEIRWLLIDQRPRRRRAAARRRRAAELESLVARRTSELERTQRLRDKLVATVSHELRTPLAAISGYAELLLMDLRGALTEAQRTDVQRIHRACEHLAKIVDDLLDYSLLAAKDLAFDIHDTPLDESLRGVMELIAPQAREKRLSVEVAVPPTIGLVRADPERLRQIVVNLAGNAIKFTPAGGTIYIRAFASNADAIVEVEDTGPGIRPSERELIFEPFVRLRPDAVTPGAGLGLSISRDMARAMEGDLTVQPGSNGGSCFALRLPLSTALAGVSHSVEPNAHA